MVSETVLQPLTPKLKISRKSLVRTIFKVTANGVVMRRMVKIVESEAKASKMCPYQYLLKN